MSDVGTYAECPDRIKEIARKLVDAYYSDSRTAPALLEGATAAAILAAEQRGRDTERARVAQAMAIYAVEGDEGTIRLSADGVIVAAHPHDSPKVRTPND